MIKDTDHKPARGRHPALPEGKPYLRNAIAFAAGTVHVSEDTPMVDIARTFRKAVLKAIEPAEIDRSFAMERVMHDRGIALHIHEAGALSYAVTNWVGCWKGLDCSAAAVDADGAKDEAAPPAQEASSSGDNMNGHANGHVNDHPENPETPPVASTKQGALEPIILGTSLERAQTGKRCKLLAPARKRTSSPGMAIPHMRSMDNAHSCARE